MRSFIAGDGTGLTRYRPFRHHVSFSVWRTAVLSSTIAPATMLNRRATMPGPTRERPMDLPPRNHC
jgi:hypothetical protein